MTFTKLRRMALASLLLALMGTASAAPVLLDLTSGVFSDPQPGGGSRTYTESGFTLQMTRTTDHMDPLFLGDIGFHNGPNNADNISWRLSFGGAAFDLIDVLAGFDQGASSFTVTGSNGQSQVVSTDGTTSTPFFNVTYVDFNIDQDGALQSVYMSAINVDTTPTVNAIPEPGSLALLGLGMAGLAGFRTRRARLNSLRPR